MARAATDHLQDVLEAIEAIERYAKRGETEFGRVAMVRDAVCARLIQIGQAAQRAA